MKKITTLLLVAVMVLASVSALAAGSPTPYGIGTSVYVPMTPAEPTVGIVDLGPTGTAYQTAVGNDENGDPINYQIVFTYDDDDDTITINLQFANAEDEDNVISFPLVFQRNEVEA